MICLVKCRLVGACHCPGFPCGFTYHTVVASSSPGALRRIALSGFAVKLGQRLPAGPEARIALHRLFIGGEGGFRLAGLAPHMPFLLKGAAIAGAGDFQAVQRFLRGGGLFQVTLADGENIERLGMIGLTGEGGFRRLGGLFRPALLQQCLGLRHRVFGVINGVRCHGRLVLVPLENGCPIKEGATLADRPSRG